MTRKKPWRGPSGLPTPSAQRLEFSVAAIEGILPRDEESTILARYITSPLPRGWKVSEDGHLFDNINRMRVIASAMRELDGRVWLHVSASFPHRVPTYAEMSDVKRVFIGDDHEAYSVWARKSKHVNLHPYCLHLWHCVDAEDGRALPDFTRGGNTL